MTELPFICYERGDEGAFSFRIQSFEGGGNNCPPE
jgi:hypothetical protein